MLSITINNLIQDLRPRQREVLDERFGLKDGQKKTLAGLGEKYGITRERVRQIENEAIKAVKERLSGQKKSLEGVSDSIIKYLENLGGMRRDNLLLLELKEVLNDNSLHHWHLRFFSEIAGHPFYYPPDENFHNFWYLDKKNLKLLYQFVDRLEKLIAEKKEDLIVYQKFDIYFSKAIKRFNIPDFIGTNYASLSRKFNTNPFGDFGLSDWEEINPKTVKSKAYLILKKQKQPMHFKEITGKINEIGFGGREAYPQTVHNELIKDPRFILVGRGIYGLQEQGFLPGITSEIITRILKDKGPLSAKELVDSVLKQRLLKENTITLNLQNKKYFKKLADGRYYLARS